MAKPTKPDARVEAVVNLSKRRGFVFPSSEIYGGTRSAWDYGPLGVELKENIRRQWWQSVVRGRDDVVGLDSSVILAPQVWEASGHVDDVRRPADRVQEVPQALARRPADRGVRGEARPSAGERPRRHRVHQLRHPGRLHRAAGLQRHAAHRRSARSRTPAPCTTCAPRPRRASSSTTSTSLNTVAQEAAVRHRPDRQELPQRDHAGQLHLPHPRVRADGDGVLRRARHRRGVARVLAAGALGLVRRPRPQPGEPALLRAPAGEAVALLQAHRRHRVPVPVRRLGVRRARGHRQPHRLRPADALASTPAPTCRYFDQETGERWIPYVIEPAAGLTRCVLAFLLDAYDEDEAPNAKGGVDKRTVLRLDPRLAPVKVAVLPLSRNEDLSPKATDLAADAAQALERRVRRRRRDRPSLPPPGRDRHAVLRHGRLRHPRGRGRHRARARRWPGAHPDWRRAGWRAPTGADRPVLRGSSAPSP